MNTKLLREETEVKQIKTDVIFPIVGYKKNPVTNRIEIDEKRAPKIRKIFNSLANTKQPSSNKNIINIPKIVFKEGINKVRLIVRNPFYCGEVKIYGKLYQGIHPPLIDMITWGIANENLGKILYRIKKTINITDKN